MAPNDNNNITNSCLLLSGLPSFAFYSNSSALLPFSTNNNSPDTPKIISKDHTHLEQLATPLYLGAWLALATPITRVRIAPVHFSPPVKRTCTWIPKDCKDGEVCSLRGCSLDIPVLPLFPQLVMERLWQHRDEHQLRFYAGLSQRFGHLLGQEEPKRLTLHRLHSATQLHQPHCYS